MYGCESWTIEKVECWRINVFELWSWKRLLTGSWTAKSSNQLILKAIRLEYSLEGLMLKLKLQYFCHLMRRVDTLEKTMMLERSRAGEEGDGRGWNGWIASLTQWTWVWANSGRQWRTGKPGMLLSMGLQSRTWLSDLTTTTKSLPACELEMVTTVSNWPSILLGASEDLYGICFRIVHLKDKRREHFYHQWTLTLYSLKE